MFAILRDLTDRRGLRQEWENIDSEIRAEIRAKWVEFATKPRSREEDSFEDGAQEIVEAILGDLTRRGGLQDAWENIDDDIRAEIRATWVKATAKFLSSSDD